MEKQPQIVKDNRFIDQVVKPDHFAIDVLVLHQLPKLFFTVGARGYQIFTSRLPDLVGFKFSSHGGAVRPDLVYGDRASAAATADLIRAIRIHLHVILPE